MKVEVEPADPARIGADWHDLAARATNPSPFRSPAWIAAWAPMAAPRCRLLAVRGTEGQRTVAMALFGLAPAGLATGLAARLFESGDGGLDGIYTEYNDVLLTEDAPKDARSAMIAAVLAETKAQSVILRNAVPSLRDAALTAARDGGWAGRVVSENPCYGAALGAPPPWSRNTRQQIARSRRLYEARGALTVEVADDAQARRRAFEALAAMHEAAWRARGEPGAFDETARAFHAALTASGDAPVEILTVRNGDAPVGALYNLLGEGKVHNYQSGFAQAADNRLKPGLTTHALAMEHYRDRGFSDYDMMAGDSRYKRSLGFEHDRLSTIELERPTLRQRLRSIARKARKRATA